MTWTSSFCVHLTLFCKSEDLKCVLKSQSHICGLLSHTFCFPGFCTGGSSTNLEGNTGFCSDKFGVCSEERSTSLPFYIPFESSFLILFKCHSVQVYFSPSALQVNVYSKRHVYGISWAHEMLKCLVPKWTSNLPSTHTTEIDRNVFRSHDLAPNTDFLEIFITSQEHT